MKSLKSLKSIRFMTLGFLLFVSVPTELMVDSQGSFSVFSSEKSCLALNVYEEARGEGYKGMLAVAAVTVNRSKHPGYPNSICKVVLQKKQFSWTNKLKYDTIIAMLGRTEDDFVPGSPDLASWKTAKEISELSEKELTSSLAPNTIHFHNKGIKPYWLDFKVKVKQIGNHVFYKEKEIK